MGPLIHFSTFKFDNFCGQKSGITKLVPLTSLLQRPWRNFFVTRGHSLSMPELLK